MIAQLQVRRGTTAEWAAASPVVLAAGEPGYDTTLKMLKFGDGTTEWASLESETLKKYPVGAIYQSTVSTSPATLFGGTWSAWGAGRVPVGIDAGQTEFDTVEETGGAKTHSHALNNGYACLAYDGNNLHMDTVDIDTAHTHNIKAATSGVYLENKSTDYATKLRGTTESGSSLPPYIVCYMWKRTA